MRHLLKVLHMLWLSMDYNGRALELEVLSERCRWEIIYKRSDHCEVKGSKNLVLGSQRGTTRKCISKFVEL